jgi:pimeloyl-ACP methyl ester carboxylesterase
MQEPIHRHSKLRKLPPPRLPFPASIILKGMQSLMQTAGRIAPDRAAAWAFNTYYSPRRSTPSNRELALASRATALSIPFEKAAIGLTPSGTLQGWSLGSEAAPIILIVHGWESRGLQIAAPYADPLLNAGYRVVTWDMPGHGQSSGNRSDVMACAEAVLSVLKHLDQPVSGVLAHSLGAAATTIALDRGAQIARAVFLAPAAFFHAFPERFCDVMHTPPSVRSAFWKRMYEVFPHDMWVSQSTDQLASKMRIPLLIAHDRDDGDTHFEGGQEVAANWPGAQFFATSGLGHRRIISSPDIVAKSVAFLTGD